MRKKKKAMYPEVAYLYDGCFGYNIPFWLGPTGTGKTWISRVRKSMSHKNKQ